MHCLQREISLQQRRTPVQLVLPPVSRPRALPIRQSSSGPRRPSPEPTPSATTRPTGTRSGPPPQHPPPAPVPNAPEVERPKKKRRNRSKSPKRKRRRKDDNSDSESSDAPSSGSSDSSDSDSDPDSSSVSSTSTIERKRKRKKRISSSRKTSGKYTPSRTTPPSLTCWVSCQPAATLLGCSGSPLTTCNARQIAFHAIPPLPSISSNPIGREHGLDSTIVPAPNELRILKWDPWRTRSAWFGRSHEIC
ncbi:unnamed protein product [Rhizoctonia solani]|uniref:Uncharacterized protein n=1 Tax=Rhizoctonia solani TaxID=456999 RepID=A0A8H3HJ80_9AGAM|nr:unnamed protein product [Rhizoctonia solani]